MALLSSPERVLRSINGQEIDRIPCYFRAEQPLCLKIEQELHLPDYTAIARYFGSDALPVAVRCQDALSITVLDDHHYLDAFGNRFYHTDNCARVDRPALAPEGELLPIDSICWPPYWMWRPALPPQKQSVKAAWPFTAEHGRAFSPAAASCLARKHFSLQ